MVQAPRRVPGAVGEFYLSGLDDYADCPFFYYCRAGLSPPGGLFNPLRAGNGYHKLWELAWRQYQGQRQL